LASNPHVRTVITCAMPNCGHEKQSTNHWIMAEVYGRTGLYFHSWDQDYFELTSGVQPLCGDECAHKLLSQFLTRLKNGEPVVPK